jgi:hypothetical protein
MPTTSISCPPSDHIRPDDWPSKPDALALEYNRSVRMNIEIAKYKRHAELSRTVRHFKFMDSLVELGIGRFVFGIWLKQPLQLEGRFERSLAVEERCLRR